MEPQVGLAEDPTGEPASGVTPSVVSSRQTASRRWSTRTRLLATAGGVLAAVVGIGLLASSGVLPRAETDQESAAPMALVVATAEPLAPSLVSDTPPGPTSDPVPSVFEGIGQTPAQPTRRTDPVSYTIAPGDVLWQIAERYGLRMETLLWANDLADPDLLGIGQTLLIPPSDGVFYTVRPNERLADIAIRYGIELGTIASANHLADMDQITAGGDLFLPGGRPLQPAAVTATTGSDDQEAALNAPPVPISPEVAALLTAGWLQAEQPTSLFRGAVGTSVLGAVPAGAQLERLDGFRQGRIQVRDAGDGRTRQAMTGWVSATDLVVGRAPSTRELPQAYPQDTAMDIAQVFAPYRSQLDGSRYAQANCGPTTLAMALEAFGVSLSSGQLRAETLNAQRIWGNDVGTLITALAEVTRQHGLEAVGLYASDGALRRWTVDDIRSEVRQGHPVVVQVHYRALPNRGGALFFGDHYIVITGLLDERFLYNDAINADGVGWDRVLDQERLQRAMDASDRTYADTAFAVAR